MTAYTYLATPNFSRDCYVSRLRNVRFSLPEINHEAAITRAVREVCDSLDYADRQGLRSITIEVIDEKSGDSYYIADVEWLDEYGSIEIFRWFESPTEDFWTKMSKVFVDEDEDELMDAWDELVMFNEFVLDEEECPM